MQVQQYFLLEKTLAIPVGVVVESCPGERRVAMVPSVIAAFKKSGVDLLVESGAGLAAGFSDSEYAEKGARICERRAEVFAEAEILLQVRAPGANPETGAGDIELLRPQQTVIGFSEPLTALDSVRHLAERQVSLFSMELMPRITRAQSMDALSSMATVAMEESASMLWARVIRGISSMENRLT